MNRPILFSVAGKREGGSWLLNGGSAWVLSWKKETKRMRGLLCVIKRRGGEKYAGVNKLLGKKSGSGSGGDGIA